ncbi:MAG: DEAD/DEAH box helicase [Rhodocyclales bacterium]|nr:DEAD/DEAH box helicase [Rhodocyclales bacterium]
MTVYIPEWTKVSGRNLQIKKVLNALDDVCVVRRPLRPTGWAPDLFVQHPETGWIAIAVSDESFSVLDSAQLFETEGRLAFEQLLARFADLKGISDPTNHNLLKLLLMWSCSPEEARVLSERYMDRFGVRLLSKEQFMRLGYKLIPRLFAQLGEKGEQLLLGHYFPEAEIPEIFTTRRHFHRDNSARLTRYFLDNQQEWAAKLDLEPPVEQAEVAKDFSVRVVNGVAGSGKTLIALNRALMLAEMFPSQRILVLIHNTPIVADIKDRLHRTRGSIPNNLEITTFFGWAHQQWRNVFQTRLKMPDRPQQEVPELIKHYRTRWPDLKLTEVQLVDELDFINESLIVDEPSYLVASRAGQGFALRAKDREQVWSLYEIVTTALAKEQQRLWSAVPREICLAESHERLSKYHHILVDEAQFFAPSWFQVVKLATEAEGHLFLCADPNQGFMKSRLSWKNVGLDVAGRTKKLRKSYRTTQAILEAASRILAQSAPGDPDDFLEPDWNGMEQGTSPLLIYTDSPQDAVDRLTNELAAIIKHGQVPLSSLLVIYGDSIQKHLLYDQLGRRFGTERIWWLNRKEHKKEPPNGYGQDYLRLAYLETATGLEASVVFLIGVESLFAENDMPGVSNEERVARKEENARKLYMAITRAGHQLVLVSTQRLPHSIESLFEKVSPLTS